MAGPATCATGLQRSQTPRSFLRRSKWKHANPLKRLLRWSVRWCSAAVAVVAHNALFLLLRRFAAVMRWWVPHTPYGLRRHLVGA
jgi:hypothetical protein